MFSFLSYLKFNIDTIYDDNKYGVVYQCLNDVNIWTLTQQLKKKVFDVDEQKSCYLLMLPEHFFY